jgi:hypothetical protein
MPPPTSLALGPRRTRGGARESAVFRRRLPSGNPLPEHTFEVPNLPLKLTNTPRIPLRAEAGEFLPFRSFPDAADDLEAVEVRELQVEDDEVGWRVRLPPAGPGSRVRATIASAMEPPVSTLP